MMDSEKEPHRRRSQRRGEPPIAAGAAGVLLGRSLQLSGDIHLAMLSRGFRGEALLAPPYPGMAGPDRRWLALFLTAAAWAVLDGEKRPPPPSLNCGMSRSGITMSSRSMASRCASKKASARHCWSPTVQANPLCFAFWTALYFAESGPSPSVARRSMLRALPPIRSRSISGGASGWYSKARTCNSSTRPFSISSDSACCSFAGVTRKLPRESTRCSINSKSGTSGTWPPHRLLGGEKKRVAIAFILALEPEVLLLDATHCWARSQKRESDCRFAFGPGRPPKNSCDCDPRSAARDGHRRPLRRDAKREDCSEGPPKEIVNDTDLLTRVNLIHSHRHRHTSGLTHSHPHSHPHEHE